MAFFRLIWGFQGTIIGVGYICYVVCHGSYRVLSSLCGLSVCVTCYRRSQWTPASADSSFLRPNQTHLMIILINTISLPRVLNTDFLVPPPTPLASCLHSFPSNKHSNSYNPRLCRLFGFPQPWAVTTRSSQEWPQPTQVASPAALEIHRLGVLVEEHMQNL